MTLFPNRDSLRAFLKANDKELCERCGCCELVWQSCEQCGGDGVFGHDCGEDTCCCLDPEEDDPCEICDGEGGWMRCVGHCEDDGHCREETTDEPFPDGAPPR